MAVMPTSVASDAPTCDRVRRWAVSGRRSPTALARLRSEADRYRLENAAQLRHLTASIAVRRVSRPGGVENHRAPVRRRHGQRPRRGTLDRTTYELIWNKRSYPPKAILGTAYEFATGKRLASGDCEGGKTDAVKVLEKLGFTIHQRRLAT